MKSFRITFQGKNGIDIIIPVTFLAGKPLQFDCDYEGNVANLYFMNDSGEWCLIAGTDSEDWNKKADEISFKSFHRQLQEVFEVMLNKNAEE